MLKKLSPLQLLILGYLVFITSGSILLLFPFSHRGHLSFTDAFFTSTSAVCVTGLIVKDTANFFTPAGKLIILFLLQIGGIGYMTVATLLLFILRGKTSLKFRITATQSFPELTFSSLKSFFKTIVIITFAFETFGTLILFTVFRGIYPPSKALFYALFNSVSAFCNAGFSTFAESLVNFRENPVVVLTIAFLIISGGIGFYIYIDIYHRYIKKSKKRVSLHTQSVFITTFILIAGGTVLFLFSEYKNALYGLTFKSKVLQAFFQSVTTRTAGFNTIDQSRLSPFGILLSMFLMFVGGSPGGTAGGIKTTTILAVLLWQLSYIKGKENTTLINYKIPERQVKKAFSVFILSGLTVLSGSLLIAIFEHNGIRAHGLTPYLFEIFSAFGTVGLSFGSFKAPYVSLSHDFTLPGKWIIILIMLTGKVGVLSLAFSMIGPRKEQIEYPEGHYVVG